MATSQDAFRKIVRCFLLGGRRIKPLKWQARKVKKNPE